MNLIIKKFDELTINELYEIIKLRVEVFVVDQQCIYQDLDGLDYDCYHNFIKKDGHIVAYTRILNKGVNFPEISFGRVLSNKSYRGHGFSKTLLKESIKFIEDELKENKIRIRAQSHALGFYKKLGFIEEGKEYTIMDIPHIDMVYMSNKGAC